MKAVIIMGSTSDEPHAKKITDKLDEYGITWEQHAASAHKQPLKVLDILTANKDEILCISPSPAGPMLCLGLSLQIRNSRLWGGPPFQIKRICW